MTAKRESTLADRFLATRGHDALIYMKKPFVEALLRKIRAAHKFVLDEDAATQVAHVVRDIPELLVRQHEFARAPFDLTWVEFPHWKFWRECGNDPLNQDSTADHTLGYLIDGNVVSVVTGGTVGEPMMAPLPGIFQYYLNSEWPPDALASFLQENGSIAEHLDRYLWGSTAERIDRETREKLRLRYQVGLCPVLKSPKADAYRDMLDVAFSGSIGELRNVIAILLMLNRPTVTRYSNAPASRGWFKSKSVPFMAHTSVTISLNAVDTMRLLGTAEGEGVPRRRHEVRGHYCHNRIARAHFRMSGCMHDWRPCGDDWTPVGANIADADRWVCAACEGKRWWRAEHERGDASIGFRSHTDYQVTA